LSIKCYNKKVKHILLFKAINLIFRLKSKISGSAEGPRIAEKLPK